MVFEWWVFRILFRKVLRRFDSNKIQKWRVFQNFQQIKVHGRQMAFKSNVIFYNQPKNGCIEN
jgi:hypothetical protein